MISLATHGEVKRGLDFMRAEENTTGKIANTKCFLSIFFFLFQLIGLPICYVSISHAAASHSGDRHCAL